jgi:hypothetical protein
MRSYAAIALSLALACGGALPARVLYHCTRTGEQHVRCCCAQAAGEAAPPCCTSAAAPAPPVPGSPGVEAVCCSITVEEGVAQGIGTSSSKEAWKQVLDEARLPVAVLAAAPPAAPETGAKYLIPPRVEPGSAPGGEPLFLVHCAFLL